MMGDTGGDRIISPTIVPSTCYRVEAFLSQLPLVALVTRWFYGRPTQPFAEILELSDHSKPPERLFEFPIFIPRMPETQAFVVEVSPYVEGLWLWDDSRRTQNLRCPPELWPEQRSRVQPNKKLLAIKETPKLIMTIFKEM